MATKPPTFSISHGGCWRGGALFPKPSPRLIPIACKMRHKNSLSSPQKKQQAKKVSPEQLPMNKVFTDTADVHSSSDKRTLNENLMLNGDESNEVRNGTEDTSLYKEIQIEENLQENDETPKEKDSADHTSHPLQESTSTNDAVWNITVESTNAADFDGPSNSEIETAHNGEHVELGDLIEMMKKADRNILLLNQARIHAFKNIDKIHSEKEALQGLINILETRLEETDAQIKVAAQDTVHMDLLEGQLEKLKYGLSERGAIEAGEDDNNYKNSILNKDDSSFNSVSKELRLLRKENISLKDDIRVLNEELNNVKELDQRILALEDERFSLEAVIKNLESRLVAAQEDVAKLSHLKVECKDLWAKVENLQELLDKATKQADEAISVLKQNYELRKKVDRLEESLEEAKVYKLSSEKAQQYNELLQQKLRLLEERLEKSDEEIHLHLQSYEESVKEFHDIINNLKEDSKRKALDEPVNDMPWEFWSRLLLMIDGWLLEKKISSHDAKLLGDMAWKRNGRICDAYLTCKNKNESEVLATLLRLISSPTSQGLHIIHIAAEMAPVAKVGGLGDVVSGLSKALQKRGHLVEIVIPKYDCMQYDHVRDLRALDVVVESYFDGQLFKNKIWVGIVEGLPVYLIEPQHPAKFFWRGQFYGERDDFKRFSYFSRAALELLLQAGKKPDIIHCHDWQTAFVAPLYWDIYTAKGLNSARICFTCHNFEYQGTTHASELASCGLDVSQLNRPDRMQDHSSHERVNPVKGAVVFSNIVTTVSPTYAQEVRTAEGGRGLHKTLNAYSKKFIGVLNGIDTDAWDPSTDSYLKVQFNFDDLLGKRENKADLRKHLKLSSADPMQPLVGCITRLVPQKGVHLIRHAIYRTMELGGQFVLLGSSPVEHIQREFEGIAKHFENHPQIRLILKYDEALSHSIYAASDMFIIPSVFEPCGLTQMIAMRYGAVPIARKTGGLNDSVFDVDDDTIPLQFRNGFTFLTPDEQSAGNALERAFSHYRKNIESWQQLVQRNMKIDFSWDSSASQYIELYEKSVARAKASKMA
ncbi:Glycogen synthase [Thalictrum thalictroides]|uniref:starch synthase n=1 Tax=Thalictrum thalictroides TaxID=46969 RepID=A0A7J6X9K7_THATH|nr:Glycogen synthase [Thalictrum thalictroides]